MIDIAMLPRAATACIAAAALCGMIAGFCLLTGKKSFFTMFYSRPKTDFTELGWKLRQLAQFFGYVAVAVSFIGRCKNEMSTGSTCGFVSLESPWANQLMRKSMLHRQIIFALLALCVPAAGWSSETDGLWILPAATACLAQYPELSDTRLGKSLAKAPQIQDHIDRAKAVFASNPWSGRALCDELMHDKPDPQRDDRAFFSDMRVRHTTVLKVLADRLPDGWFALKPVQ